MSSEDNQAVTSPILFEWIAADLAVLEAFLSGDELSADDHDFYTKEAPLALENARACLSELKTRWPGTHFKSDGHPADARARRP